MPNFITKLLSGGAKEIVDSVGNVLDNVITNKEELAKAKLEADKEINRHIEMMATQSISVYELEVKDRESARDMFKHSSQLQKIYSITFLSAYVFLTVCMLIMVYQIAVNQVHVPDWAIGFISTLFGAMSVKVGTITDFLFGSSFQREEKTGKPA